MSLKFREDILQRLTKIETEFKGLKESLLQVVEHSNHDITAINNVICKQQEQMDFLIKEYQKLKLKEVKNTLTSNILIFIGGGIALGLITLLFSYLGKLLGL